MLVRTKTRSIAIKMAEHAARVGKTVHETYADMDEVTFVKGPNDSLVTQPQEPIRLTRRLLVMAEGILTEWKDRK